VWKIRRRKFYLAAGEEEILAAVVPPGDDLAAVQAHLRSKSGNPGSDGETPSKPRPTKQCGDGRSGNKRGWSRRLAVLTRAEAPLGERSTTWATPFQSLITSSPDLGSMELTKRPMLIDGQPSSKQRARTAAREAERARAGED